MESPSNAPRYSRPRTLQLKSEGSQDEECSPSGSRIPQPPKSILKVRRSSSGERISMVEKERPFDLGASVRRLHSLPARTPRPRVYRHPRLSSIGSDVGSEGGSARQTTRIPKMSVSWWETNSIAGEAPLLESESDDDASSVCSHGSTVSGMSNISQNWKGRSTRYVPHCAKRHMHKNDNPEDYLTPTQRKNRLIADLRKELRGLHKVLEEKDRHITQLRDRLTEMETVMDQGGYLSENHRLLAKIGQIQEQHRREKETLSAKYDARIRKLKKSVVSDPETDLTSEGFQASFESGLIPPPPVPEGPGQVPADPVESPRGHLTPGHKFLHSNNALSPDSGLEDIPTPVLKINVGTVTDPDPTVQYMESQLSSAYDQIRQLENDSGLLQDRVNELELSDARIHELEEGMTHHSITVGSGLVDSATSRAGGCEAELVAQLEAYKAECIVWRTRASESELKGRDAAEQSALKIEGLEQQLVELERIKAEQESLLAGEGDECPNPICIERCERLEEVEDELAGLQSTKSMHSTSAGVSPRPLSPGESFECRSALMTPRRRRAHQAAAELHNLNEELELRAKLLEAEKEQLTEKMTETENALAVKSEQLTTSVEEIVHLKKEMHNRQTALEVAEITMERMRDDIVRAQEQNKALNGKIQTLEDSGRAVPDGDSGVSVTPAQSKKRSRYNIVQTMSRQLQTTLSGKDVEERAGQLVELRTLYENLREKYELESADYNLRISQISENLSVKNSVSETLGLQLQDLQETYEEARTRWAEERTCLNDRIAELTPVAQRVPTLEKQLLDSNQEIDQLIHDHRLKMEEMNTALEHSLTGAMSANKDAEQYWKDKVVNLETELENSKKKAVNAQKDLKETTLRLNLEKSQLEALLGEKSKEIGGLHSELYRPKHHIRVQTMELGIDKAVTAMIEMMDSETQFIDGDLYDEKAESIKVLQGELAASRRQIEVLGEKLADFTRLASCEKDEKVSALVKLIEHHQSELENLKVERITDISEKSSLEQKVEILVKERDSLKKKAKENLECLEQEFQLVQKELQSVVRRYENAKQRQLRKLRDARNENDIMKWKLKVLKQEVVVLANSHGGSGETKANFAKLESLFDDDAVERSESFEEVMERAVVEEVSEQQNLAVARSMVDSGISERLDSPAKTAAVALARSTAKHQFITASSLTLDSDTQSLEEPPADYSIEAKICTLADNVLTENSTLRDDLEGLREKVDVMLRESKSRRDSKPVEIEVGAGDAASSEGGDQSSTTNGDHLSSSGDQATTTDQLELLEAIRTDLMTALDDHGRITAAASNVVQTAQASMAADSKFRKLEKWLQTDIQQEKLELETMCQWYEKDKFKLGDALRNAKQEILSLSKERDSLREILRDMQSQLSTLEELYREVSREMYIIKMEDARNSELKKEKEISKSESDVHSRAKEEEEKWKSKVGKIYKEKVLLEKKFRAARYEKSEADQNVVMLRGELEVVKAAYETERDKLLAKILEVTGEVWSEEASTNYVRELQQNLEIKKQELFDLSRRYDRDTRQLQEELYAERAKRIPDELEGKFEKLRSQLAPESTPGPEDSASNVSNASQSSKILLKRELEKERSELVLLANELKSEKGKFETMVKDLRGKLRISGAILTEKENLTKIMDGELRSLQAALDEQNTKYDQDTGRLREEIQKLINENASLKDQSKLPEDSPISLAELEKSWKRELKESHARYDMDVRSIRRDMIMLNERFDNCRRDASQKMKAVSNILTEKENNIKILERELRSAEDGLAKEKLKYSKMERKHLATINELQVLLAKNNISAPVTPTRSLSPDPTGEFRPPKKGVHFDVPPSGSEVSSIVMGELENYRTSYENLRHFDLDEWTKDYNEVERIHESPKKELPSIRVEYVEAHDSPDAYDTAAEVRDAESLTSASPPVENPGDDVPPEHVCLHCDGHADSHTDSGDSDERCSALTSEASEIAQHALSSYDDRSSGSARTESMHTCTEHEESPPVDPEGPGGSEDSFPRVHTVGVDVKVLRLTKELNMINNELEVTREKFYEDKRRWIAENALLKERLAEMEKLQM